MSGILMNVGAIVGIWGVLWFLWDKHAVAPGWLLGIALICLGVGVVL